MTLDLTNFDTHEYFKGALLAGFTENQAEFLLQTMKALIALNSSVTYDLKNSEM